MSICHIINGQDAAVQLQQAMALCNELQGEVLMLHDDLSVGPIKKGEGDSFSALRNSFWQNGNEAGKPAKELDDMERLLELSRRMYKDPELAVWVWIAPTARDVVAYFWSLPYLGKHLGRYYVVNINSLPFLDGEGKLYYPKNFAAILPKELVKARKLVRPVTPSEAETDMDEWQRLVTENGGIRELAGGKKIKSLPAEHYDQVITGSCTAQFQKLGKLVQLLTGKQNLPLSEAAIAIRVKQLCDTAMLEAKGTTDKLKDFEVRLPGNEVALPQNMHETGGITTVS